MMRMLLHYMLVCLEEMKQSMFTGHLRSPTKTGLLKHKAHFASICAKLYLRRYPIPPYVFCVSMGVYAVHPLEGSVECQTASINKLGDRRECYFGLIDFFICHCVLYRNHHIDTYNFVPHRRDVLRNHHV